MSQTGPRPADFYLTIQRMMTIRYDTAHGKWILPLSAADCENFLSTVLHLAIRTDEKVYEYFR
jgi:hypothetical protein